MADELSEEENQELVESLATYVANLAQLPVGQFAEADARNILNAVQSAESNTEKRLLLPGLLTMVDIRLADNVFYVSGELPNGETSVSAYERTASGKYVRFEECTDLLATIN